METVNYATLAGHLQGGLLGLKTDIELLKAMNFDPKVSTLLKSKIDRLIANANAAARK